MSEMDPFDLLAECKMDYGLGMATQGYSEAEMTRLLDEYDEALATLRARAEAMEEVLRKWVRHYEQTAPDDANTSDFEWALWFESRAALARHDEAMRSDA